MTPWVVVALLAGFALGGLLRRAETMAARRAARRWRYTSQRWQAEVADAYSEVAFLAGRNEELHKAVEDAVTGRYDAVFLRASGIDVGGEA
jgi:hypothetical protein